jgi:hypothetical protein
MSISLMVTAKLMVAEELIEKRTSLAAHAEDLQHVPQEQGNRGKKRQ